MHLAHAKYVALFALSARNVSTRAACQGKLAQNLQIKLQLWDKQATL